MRIIILTLTFSLLASAWRVAPPAQRQVNRREAVQLIGAAAGAAVAAGPNSAQAGDIQLTMDLSGIRWADIREGTGPTPKAGRKVTIDYMMTRQAGAKIYSSKDAQQPFTWVLGDGKVIEGLEIGILGQGGIPPMKEGGVRRLLIPQLYGYGSNRGYFQDGTPTEVRDKYPQPPKDFIWVDKNGDRVNAYMRFKDTYMNEMRLDEPGLILDVILKSSGGAVAAVEVPTATAPEPEPEQAWAAPPAGAAVEQPAAAAAPVAAAPAAAVDSTEAELAALREKLARLQQQGS
jgi:hypothetical protein